MKYRRLVVSVLVALNVVLFGVLIQQNLQTAEAAPYRSTDYVVTTGAIGSGWDAIYVLDLSTQRLAAWKWDKAQKSLAPISGQRLDRDFKISDRR